MGEVLTNSQIGGRRNLIINGAMQVAQRGTSFTSQNAVAYHLDRWETSGFNMGDGVYRVDQSTDAPADFMNSTKIACTTADTSQDANNQMYFQQQIEGLNCSHVNFFVSNADTITLSFHVKSNRTGTYSFALKLSDNASVENNTSTRIYNTTYTISVANTFEKKTITIPLDTNGSTKVTNNTFSMAIQFWLGAGSNRDGDGAGAWGANGNAATASANLDILGSTDNNWYITGVQMEIGSQATPFEHRSFGEELALCQRYFEASTISSVAAFVTDTIVLGNGKYAITKRANPTIAYTTNFTLYVGGAAPSISSLTVDGTPTTSGFIARCTSSASNNSEAALIQNGVYTADSEL
tara:strand:- start:143 stop:1198 length:1056 start_codon:yes stop_codon:yes gene_type:complete